MKKGAVEIALAVAIIIIAAVGFYSNVMIGKQITKKELAKEIKVIETINLMEAVKRGLPYALYYSFEEALKRGGYASFSEVQDLENFRLNVSQIFSEYREEIEEKTSVLIPFGKINIAYSDEEVNVSFYSSGLMKYKYASEELSFEIFDNPNVTIRVKKGEFLEE